MDDSYFDDAIPNYEARCTALAFVLVATSIFWIVIFPFVANQMFFDAQPSKKKAEEPTSTSSSTTKKEQAAPSKQRRGKNKKSADKKTSTKILKEEVAPEEPPSVPLVVLAVAALGCMTSLFCEVMTLSPYNTFVARGVFQVPLFTTEECEQLVNISMKAAQHNQEEALRVRGLAELSGEALNKTMASLLMEPEGWQKSRHSQYPTTDLNIITDPFDKQSLQWLQEKLDARLAPTLSKIYGIPESAIRANDMFVVRYDSEFRAHLSNHTDDSDISFNVLLTEQFEGGGTRFWNRQIEQPFAHVQPTRAGQMLTHSALIHHEGMPTTQGTRIIFVGFLSVDRIDPFTLESTGLSTFASWLSLPWLSTKFKEAYISAHYRRLNKQQKWTTNKYAMALFLDLANIMQVVGDYFASHHVHDLVAGEKRDDYFKALDNAYRVKTSGSSESPADNKRASWFAGQQIDLDIDGTITSEWYTRRTSKNRFMEL